MANAVSNNATINGAVNISLVSVGNVNYGKEFWKEDGEPETGALGIIYHQLICGHCKERKPIGGLWAYCPYCGAKMYTDRYMKQDGSIEYTNASIV